MELRIPKNKLYLFPNKTVYEKKSGLREALITFSQVFFILNLVIIFQLLTNKLSFLKLFYFAKDE